MSGRKVENNRSVVVRKFFDNEKNGETSLRKRACRFLPSTRTKGFFEYDKSIVQSEFVRFGTVSVRLSEFPCLWGF
jgi:hypothetical protein